MRFYKWMLVGLLLSLVSCAPAMSPQEGFQSVAQKNKIIFMRRDGQHATLNWYLKVVKEYSKYDDNGLFSGIVIFNNNRYKVKGNPDLVCDVQFVFFDEDGMELEKTNWQPYLFNPGMDTVVKQVSMNPNSRDYKVYVREPKTPD